MCEYDLQCLSIVVANHNLYRFVNYPWLFFLKSLFSHWVVSNSLWIHGLQCSRLPYPSPIPRAYSNVSPLSQWCHPTVSSSVVHFSFCHQSFPASGSFLMSWLFTSGDQNIGTSASASILAMSIQGWFPCCPRDSQESSPARQFKSSNSLVLCLLYDSALTTVCDYWKDHSLDHLYLCWQRFLTQSSFLLAFLPRSNHFPISWLQASSTVILEPKNRKSIAASTFSPSICHWAKCHDLFFFLIFSFTLTFWLSSFTLIKRLFIFSSLSAIRVVSSAYLRLLMFLLPILIPACNFSRPAFLMMPLACKLNKQGGNKQLCHIPFSILNQSVLPYTVLTVASWPVYRFLRR